MLYLLSHSFQWLRKRRQLYPVEFFRVFGAGLTHCLQFGMALMELSMFLLKTFESIISDDLVAFVGFVSVFGYQLLRLF